MDLLPSLFKDSQDFSNIIDKILNTEQNPDIVIVSGLTSDGEKIIFSLREKGFEGVIIGGNGLNAREVFNFCKQHCNGVIVAQSYDYNNPSDINSIFLKIYNVLKDDDMPEYPTQFTAQMFTAIQVIVESLQEIDTSKSLKNMSLYNLRSELNNKHLSGMTFDTVLGSILFDKDGDIQQTDGFYSSTIMEVNSDGTKGIFQNNDN